jgi:hypothetical protein
MHRRYIAVLRLGAWTVAILLLVAAGAVVYLTQRYVHPPGRQAFVNGRIVTMDAANSLAEAVVVEGDRILMVGSDAEARKFVDAGTKVVDLHGRTMMPGIVDAHSHFPGSGLSAVAVDFNSPPIGTTVSLEDGYARLRAKVADTPRGRWVMGYGLDNTLIAERRFPTMKELDAISTEHPIYVQHISGHLGVANSTATALLGITRDTPDPEGGKIEHDPRTGELTGLITESLALRAMAMATDFRWSDAWRMLGTAADQYLAVGVTTAQMGLLEENYRRTLVPLARLNLIPLRLVVLPSPVVASGILEGRIYATDTPRLHWGAFKIVLDGSIQGFTAFLSEPYFRPPSEGYRGYLSFGEKEFRDTVMRYQAAGRQMAVHVCGDAAMDVFIDAFAAAQRAHPVADPRAIAMHALTIRPDQLDRAKELGITPSFSSAHVYYWGDRHTRTFLGPERAAMLTPERTALEKGVRFTNNMDTPVVPMNPWLLASITVARKTSEGHDLGPNERIDALTALRSITIDAAWQAFLEKDRGSIERGKYADLLILSDDPLRNPDNLRNIVVDRTIVGGVTVFERRL